MQLQSTSPSFITQRKTLLHLPPPPPAVIQILLLTTDLFIGFTQSTISTPLTHRHKHTHRSPPPRPLPPNTRPTLTLLLLDTSHPPLYFCPLRPPSIQLSLHPPAARLGSNQEPCCVCVQQVWTATNIQLTSF